MLDRLPIPDFRKIDKNHIRRAVKLLEDVQSKRGSWDEIDEWVAELYELSSRDLQVINDTLEFNLPFEESQQAAQTVPSTLEQKVFCQALLDELMPWCKRLGTVITVQPHVVSPLSPWLGVVVQNAAYKSVEQPSRQEWEGLVRAADDLASSELLIRNDEGSLLIGRLAQRRYWSVTQARLLAQRIVGSHIDLLKAGVPS